MMTTESKQRHGESGNVIFYILLAVGLLGALTYAVAQGSRTSVTALTNDRSELLASQVIEYSDVLSKAVSQMRLRGTTLSDLRFAHDDLNAAYGTYGDDPDNEVFHPDGGGVNYHTLSAETTAAADWIFNAENPVQDIGITCAGSTCSELLAIATGINEQVCVAINELIGVNNPGGSPPADAAVETDALFAGAFAYDGEIIGDGDGSVGGSAMAGESAACILDDNTGENIFYQVLWRQ